MKIARRSLQRALELFNAAFGPNVSLAIRFYQVEEQGRCSITGDGLAMSLRCQFDCPVGQFEDAVVIGLGEFSAFVNGVKAENLTFKEKEKTHVISAGGARLTRQKNFEAMAESNTNWDKLEKFPRQLTFPSVAVVAKLSKPLYRMVSSAADEILKTVKIESAEGSISLFGTDTFRLAEAKLTTETEEMDLVLPARVFSTLALFEDSQRELKLGAQRTNWLVETSRDEDDFSVQLYGSQIAGTYPNLGVLLADAPKSVAHVDSATLAQELKLHSAVDKGNKYTVGTLRFAQDKLELTTQGTTSLNTVIEGDGYKPPAEELEMSLRFKYLLDALDFVDCETVALGRTEERGMLMVAPVVKDSEVSMQCLIAPINL